MYEKEIKRNIRGEFFNGVREVPRGKLIIHTTGSYTTLGLTFYDENERTDVFNRILRIINDTFEKEGYKLKAPKVSQTTKQIYKERENVAIVERQRRKEDKMKKYMKQNPIDAETKKLFKILKGKNSESV